MTTLVGLAFIAASVMRLELLQEAHRELFSMALGIAVVALCVLSIASYAVVRAIEWASRHWTEKKPQPHALSVGLVSVVKVSA
jgi:uncharacterized membrane protein